MNKTQEEFTKAIYETIKDNGAFEDDGWDRFIEALGHLITGEEYRIFSRLPEIQNNKLV